MEEGNELLWLGGKRPTVWARVPLNFACCLIKPDGPKRSSLSFVTHHRAMAAPLLLFPYAQASWLANLVGVDMPTPKEFDDPNATCTNLLGSCKKLGFAAPSYHPSKLTVRGPLDLRPVSCAPCSLCSVPPALCSVFIVPCTVPQGATPKPSLPYSICLQLGHGREVCGVLDGLVDYVLERRNFTFKKPLYIPDT